jgi:hypothetical protein
MSSDLTRTGTGVVSRCPMTDEQVERVAREWCRLAGVDPDTLVGHGADADARGFVPDVWMHSPRWTRVASAVRERDRMDRAFCVLDEPR